MTVKRPSQPGLFSTNDVPAPTEVQVPFGSKTQTHFIRTTWMLSARSSLEFSDSSRVRLMSVLDAAALGEQIAKHNVFARHQRESNFYVQRAKLLGGRTIIEVLRPGPPKATATSCGEIALDLERMLVLSTTIAMPRTTLHSSLGVGTSPLTETTLILGPKFYSLKASASPPARPRGVLMDRAFCARFARCGFHDLLNAVWSETDLGGRLRRSLEWLFDSRLDTRIAAAAVKTSIALESLLVFNETEPLSRTLSERAAFIISPDPARREQISQVIKRFYGARSATVHGHTSGAKSLTGDLLEGVDRLTLLLCLVIAGNGELWPDASALQLWCERQRWGPPSRDVEIPFSDIYLANSIRMAGGT